MSTEGVIFLTVCAIWVLVPAIIIPLLARPYVRDGRRATEKATWAPRLRPGYLFARFWVRLPRSDADRIATGILAHLRFHTRYRKESIYQFVLPNGAFVTLEDRLIVSKHTGRGLRSLWLMRHRATDTRTRTRRPSYSFSGSGAIEVPDGWFNWPMTERQESWVLSRLSNEAQYAYAIRDRDRDEGSTVIRPAEPPRHLSLGEDTRLEQTIC